MTNASTIKELSEINALAKSLQDRSQKLMARLGSENGSSPALRKKSGLSPEQIVKARAHRDRVINKQQY